MDRVERLAHLNPSQTTEILALVSRATAADGLAPLSEHVLLHLRHGGDTRDRHYLAIADDGAIAGYAHLDDTDAIDGPSIELAVDPAHRRRGIGHALVSALRADVPGRVRLWAHGEQAPARALAESMGFRRARVLLQLRRSLRLTLPDTPMPDGVTVRAFRPGVDDAAWLDLNARAFAEHPEQGDWTPVDLQRRLAESWFDPDGFLLAEADGRLVGCHWTKVHGASTHGHEPIGEVYVLAVDPDRHGSGLGRALTVAGLRHLRDRGLSQAMLYVDADNHAAVGLYESLGFARWDTDVEYHSAG